MKEVSGRIINWAKENEPVPGCTISKQIHRCGGNCASLFTLSKGTSISAESYEYHKLWMVYSGEIEAFNAQGDEIMLKASDCMLTPVNVPLGVRASEDAVYLEIELRKETEMNELIKAGEAFKLAELLPYREGQIVNMDLVNEENLKFVLMSFDAGTGLSEHAAPGEALVMALDGEAVIGYEGKDHVIHAGETFKFDKLGKHSVTANSRFKMALMLVLE